MPGLSVINAAFRPILRVTSLSRVARFRFWGFGFRAGFEGNDCCMFRPACQCRHQRSGELQYLYGGCPGAMTGHHEDIEFHLLG